MTTNEHINTKYIHKYIMCNYVALQSRLYANSTQLYKVDYDSGCVGETTVHMVCVYVYICVVGVCVCGCIALYKIVIIFYIAKPMMIFPFPTVSLVASSRDVP